ncbi:hypothetical protein SAMN04487775_11262 [Treponema bryantii]|uniref:Uncharacterized protein n=1 Tax=Treponema bryantii TaxID=163 RepID=A0A1I3N7N0_9SPIR|nr:hypothetical protein [Treponema bryantii]SFJ04876.1 hypothetical protein SAMN04487775_11262 [Treponema bryantii]
MATTSNLSAIIRYYAEKQKSPFIDLKEFCVYIKKYAEHHVEEQSELVKYLGDPTGTVVAELQGLSEKKLVAIINSNNKKTIVSITYLASKYANLYKDMMKNESIPYPQGTDLPKQFPNQVLEHKAASQYIPAIIEKENTKSPLLYVLDFSRDLPSMLIPACVPIKALLDTAQQKVRKILKKDEFHDYFLKKLRSTNPTKEISIKNFYTHFVDTENYQFAEFNDGEDYYIWNQSLYYIRQDFEKIQDRTVEDTNILQAVQILETHSSYLKEKFQNEHKRAEAIKELESALAKPPYFYSMPQILKFQDNNGRTLYGQYTEDDLKEFLQKMTTDGEANELPQLLVFKVESGTRYYVYKKKVSQVVVRLCNEAHESIAKQLEDHWYEVLLDYERLPEMSNASEFEACLHEMVEKNSPILYALLNANFMNILSYESAEDNMDSFRLFVDGKLLPYSDLLMLKNSKILTNAKSRLPFYYTLPVISWIMSLFNGRKKEKKRATSAVIAEKNPFEEEEKKSDSGPKLTKTQALAANAKEIAKDLVPEGSTLDRELNYLTKQWNKMISKEAYNNLTEDVNSLIRDYTRRVVKTLSATSFTRERVENLAKTLVNTPNMQKIKEEKALTEYVILYMLRLVSNFQ